ncbi:MAG: hypothetical protein LBS00_00775 [Synergistaceae bacterium]|nr:hypothetical protein [Synergistaceae bacterium]
MEEWGNERVYEAYSKIYQIAPRKYQFSIPEEIGSGCFRQIGTRGNVIVSEFKMSYKRDVHVEGTSEGSNVDICFCLGEGLAWESQTQPNPLEIGQGETFISRNGRGLERTCYSKNREFNFAGVRIPDSRFREILGDYTSEAEEIAIAASADRFAKYKMTPSARIVLQHLLACPYRNAMSEMYIEGKLAGIIAGGLEGGSLIDCTAKGGSVTATGNESWALGGVSGAPFAALEITNCKAENVTITALGGSMESSSNPTTPSVFAIENCSADGVITGGAESVGSITGYAYADSTVENCRSGITWNGSPLDKQVGSR